MSKAIIVNKLVKNFEIKKKQISAVKNLSFSIEEGELVGFIGPNGAGKTTTLKTLSGLIFPTSGFVEVLTYNPWERNREYLKQISLIMGQRNQLWWDLPAIETFELNKAIYEISTHDFDETLKELVNLMGVEKLLTTPVRKLSLGQRMRMELIASLLHKPKVLFLDEPTIGLDLVAQLKVRDFIYEYNKKYKATILLTSHNMDDLVNLARRVIVINEGKLIFDGPFESLQTRFAKEKTIKVTLSNDENISDIEKIGKIKKLEYPEVTLSVPRTSAALAASELLQNFPVEDLIIEEVPIEDVIRRVFKNS